jgi:hypothetical protein
MALTVEQKELAALELQKIMTPKAFGKKPVPPLVRIGNATVNGTYWVDIIQNGQINQKEIAETLLAKHAQDYIFANAKIEPLSDIPDVKQVIEENNESKAIHNKQFTEPPRPSIHVVNPPPSNVNHSIEPVESSPTKIVKEMVKVMDGLDHHSGLYKKLAPILKDPSLSDYKKCMAMQELGNKIDKSLFGQALMKVGLQEERRGESQKVYELMRKIDTDNPGNFLGAVQKAGKAEIESKADISPRRPGQR